jgi:hypothetical protein
LDISDKLWDISNIKLDMWNIIWDMSYTILDISDKLWDIWYTWWDMSYTILDISDKIWDISKFVQWNHKKSHGFGHTFGISPTNYIARNSLKFCTNIPYKAFSNVPPAFYYFLTFVLPL